MALTEAEQGGIEVGVISSGILILCRILWIANYFKRRGLEFPNLLKSFMGKRQMRAALRAEDTAPRGTV